MNSINIYSRLKVCFSEVIFSLKCVFIEFAITNLSLICVCSSDIPVFGKNDFMYFAAVKSQRLFCNQKRILNISGKQKCIFILYFLYFDVLKKRKRNYLQIIIDILKSGLNQYKSLDKNRDNYCREPT